MERAVRARERRVEEAEARAARRGPRVVTDPRSLHSCEAPLANHPPSADGRPLSSNRPAAPSDRPPSRQHEEATLADTRT